MKGLYELDDDELNDLEAILKFTDTERDFWKSLVKRKDDEHGEHNYSSHIEFYKEELKQIDNRFNDRVPVKKLIYDFIGYSYQKLAVETFKDKGPGIKTMLCQEAVEWFQLADEIAGYYTETAIRQADCCLSVVKYGRESGMDDEILAKYARKSSELLRKVLGPNSFFMSKNQLPERFLEMADEKLGSNVYLFKFKAPKNEIN